MKNIMEHKGITLVALVVTIIILLILAGITISQLIGNGIFNKVKEAKKKYNEAETFEKTEIEKMANTVDIESNRDSITISTEDLNRLIDERVEAKLNAFNTYSEGERAVGTWTNGKTIYERIVNIDAGAQAQQTWKNYETSVKYEIEELISATERSNLTSISQCGAVSVANNNGKLRIKIFHADGYVVPVKSVILQYTKKDTTENTE